MRTALEQQIQMASSSAPHWRKRAQTRFREVGWPSREQEAFCYLPLSQLYQEEFGAPSKTSAAPTSHKRFLLPECEGQQLIFIDGFFRPELSLLGGFPKEAIVLPLNEALGPYGQFLQGRLSRSLSEETDPFALLNGLFFEQGLFLYIPPQLKLSRPIQCLHLIQDADPAFLTPRVHLFMGAGASVEWIDQTQGGGGHLIAPVCDAVLEEGAHLRYTHWNLVEKNGWLFHSLRASLKKSASLNALLYTEGAKSSRFEGQIRLQEEGASFSLKGLAQLSGQRQAHAHLLVEHRAPYTRSEQLYKQVLDDQTQGSFEGKILVRPEALKTEAYQLNKNLLLGPRAQAFSKPNLEIYADDVKASHGATAAQLDDQQLLYLQMRGLSSETARRLLVDGFSREILAQIPYPTLQRLSSHGL